MRCIHAHAERAGFSQRLLGCLKAHGSTGGATALASAYNSKSSAQHVSPHATRKWLLGEAIPTQEKIVILAKWLGVSPSWLRFGLPESDLPCAILEPIHASVTSDIPTLTTYECTIVRGVIDTLLMLRPRSLGATIRDRSARVA